jgi:glucokinase
MDHVIGVDLGGTQIRAVRAGMDGRIEERRAVLTLAAEGPLSVLDRMRALVASVWGEGGVQAIAVGVPGPTDPYRGVLLTGPNLPGWHEVDLKQELGAHFAAPVFVGNDANLAGLAEHRFGAGVGFRHMVYITHSTGIGTSVIIDGRMLLGRMGLAAEIGHTTINLSADSPQNNLVGTLEGMTSGPNFARRAQIALRAGAISRAVELAGGDIAAVTPVELSQAAREGDAFALEQYRLVGRYLGTGIVNILHTFNPECIVIGGGVWLHCRDLMVDSMWETIRSRAQSPAYWQDLEIRTAALGDDVGLLGAVALALDGLRGERSI